MRLLIIVASIPGVAAGTETRASIPHSAFHISAMELPRAPRGNFRIR
jgi:hypothetical protein